MRFYNYINEISIKKNTIISSPIYKKERSYEQEIKLEDGLKFRFIGNYSELQDMWEVMFEDENKIDYKEKKREGAGLELFAALEKVFKQFIENTLPNKFRFKAYIEEKSRIKLYNTLAKKIEKFGFKFTQKQSTNVVIYDFTHWSVK